MGKTNKRVVFKPYQMGQIVLLPPSLEELIPEKHLVRVINDLVEEIEIGPILQQYKGGGTSSYHPRMMLKILIYAYTKQIYSSRQIGNALRENIHFMWLGAGNQPDFRTINRFRGQILKECIQPIFAEVITYLAKNKLVQLDRYFVDGTKIEADANKYSFVWKKSTDKYRANLDKNIKELFEKIDALNQAEDAEYGEKDLEEVGEESEVNSEELKELAQRLSEKLKGQPKDKKLKKAIKKLEGDYIPRKEKYERYARLFSGRNSFSKTDTDATFLRMKDDHMRNRELKPGYNIQIGTENQYIIGFSTHQNTTDSPCLNEHLRQVKENLGFLPGKIIADAGYGSEENYLQLEQENIEAFVKYNTFYQEQKKRRKIKEKEKYYARYFKYDEKRDEFICPQGQRLIYEKTILTKTDNGFASERRIYRGQKCEGCPAREQCTRSKYGRSIQYSARLNRFRQEASKRLTSPEGIQLRSQRLIEAEAVFGLLKNNLKFRRFHLRGKEKVNTEWGLISIAHNMIKMAAI
jgi:transposase